MQKMFNIAVTEDQLAWLQKCITLTPLNVVTPIEVSKTDPHHPTNKAWVMNDPLVIPPPTNGESLLVIQQGGVLITSPWDNGYWAWAYKPAIPQSVKDRMYGR
jgi:hypothetical protein